MDLSLMFGGIGVVLSVLVLLWAACWLVGLIFRDRVAAQPEPEPAREGIPSHHIAAITAAVAAVTPGAFRIINVRAPALVATAWADEGRFEQAQAHRVRWDWKAPANRLNLGEKED